jgi:hypothetical protein
MAENISRVIHFPVGSPAFVNGQPPVHLELRKRGPVNNSSDSEHDRIEGIRFALFMYTFVQCSFADSVFETYNCFRGGVSYRRIDSDLPPHLRIFSR